MFEKLKPGDRLLILSPHLDDAMLSVGGTMQVALNGGVSVIAGTIFTADADEAVASSPRVQELHALWGLGANPSGTRRAEDIVAVQLIGGDYIHGDLPDALYRTGPDGKALYPTTQAIFSEPSPKEQVWLPLRRLLEDWLARVAPRFVLCPLTVGRHVDHVVTSEAFREIWTAGAPQVCLYEDMPYAAGFAPAGVPDTVEAAIARSRWPVGRPISVAVEADKKVAAIRKYTSQLPELFPRGRVKEDVESSMRLDAMAPLKTAPCDWPAAGRALHGELSVGFHERLWLVE